MQFQIHSVLIPVHLYFRTVTSIKAKFVVVTSERISRNEMLCKFGTVMIKVRYKMYYDLHPENICVNIKCCNP